MDEWLPFIKKYEGRNSANGSLKHVIPCEEEGRAGCSEAKQLKERVGPSVGRVTNVRESIGQFRELPVGGGLIFWRLIFEGLNI